MKIKSISSLSFSALIQGILLSFVLLGTTSEVSAQTLEECQKAAENNYPLIKQYDLIRSTADATIGNINKGWLPQITAFAQATAQNRVPEFPQLLSTMMESQGFNMKGLGKEQYKIGVDVNQMIYDGGRIKLQKDIVRRQSELESARNDVDLYALRRRVNELYFGVLLLDDKLKLNADLQNLLSNSERQLASMVKSGVAATSDLDALKAERLNAQQSAVEIESQKASLLQTLALFTGKPITEVTKPVFDENKDGLGNIQNATDIQRPEINLFNKQIELSNAQKVALDSRLRPTLSAFAQGFYGYPGFDMFKDMMGRTPTLNALLGLRLSWNIGALYTRKNDLAKLNLQDQMARNQLDLFLFNNRLETTQQQRNIEKFKKLKLQDDEIIALRTSVRKAAESKLAHGIIDVNGLLKEINNENNAKIVQSIHDIELLKEIYMMKYSLNR